ncbi:MAG: hypothetical protein QGG40_01450, partial [Myxococcota bacterium]|nr:hypothetical protein [Myxococcota bacterium]
DTAPGAWSCEVDPQVAVEVSEGADATMIITTNLLVNESALSGQLQALITSDFTHVEFVGLPSLRVRSGRLPGLLPVPLDPALRVLQGNLRLGTPQPEATPRVLRLEMRCRQVEDWRPQVTATRTVVNSHAAIYGLDEPVELPPGDLPLFLEVRPLGQERAAGRLAVVPEQLRGRWRRPRRGAFAEAAQGGPGSMDLDDFHEHWDWEPGRALLSMRDGQAEALLEVPLDDMAFEPVLPMEPQVSLEPGQAPRIHAPADPRLRVWVPGYTSYETSVETTGRLRGSLSEVLAHARQRSEPLRMAGERSRGVWQAPPVGDGSLEELLPTLGGFPVHSGSWLVWFRGLWMSCTFDPAGTTGSILRLTEPIPCDGRLGRDLGPFLPLRVDPIPDGRLLVRAGSGQEFLSPYTDPDGARGWREDAPSGHLLHQWDELGFAPQIPRRPAVAWAWHGLIFSEHEDGFGFVGWWVPSEGASWPDHGPFLSYGLRPGPPTPTTFTMEEPPPGIELPDGLRDMGEQVRRELLTQGFAPTRGLDHESGHWQLEGYHDPAPDGSEPIPVVLVTAPPSRPHPHVRLFRVTT